MMKQKSSPIKPSELKVTIIDGPPLDFSFKNIRNLSGKTHFILETLQIDHTAGTSETAEELPKS